MANFSVEPISLDERPGRRRLQSVNEMDREDEGSQILVVWRFSESKRTSS